MFQNINKNRILFMIIIYNFRPTFNIRNSIIWNNDIIIDDDANLSSFSINYSNIQGGWPGEGNIDSDPLFITTDYSLQNNSPCIDSGDPDLWYQDIDGTISDMGSKGGLFVSPNFKDYNFGDVSDFGSSIEFKLYNFRETPISISSVSFSSTSFNSNTIFPIIIHPLDSGIININANNSTLGLLVDDMEIISEDLPSNLSINLSSVGVEGNVLNGNLSGTYDVAEYRISGDITVAS